MTIFPVWMGKPAASTTKRGSGRSSAAWKSGTSHLPVLLLQGHPGHPGRAARACSGRRAGRRLRLVTSTCNTVPITMFAKTGSGWGSAWADVGLRDRHRHRHTCSRLRPHPVRTSPSPGGRSWRRTRTLVAAHVDGAPLIDPGIRGWPRNTVSTRSIDLAAATRHRFSIQVIITRAISRNRTRATLARFVRLTSPRLWALQQGGEGLMAQGSRPAIRSHRSNLCRFRALIPRDTAPSIKHPEEHPRAARWRRDRRRNVNDYYSIFTIIDQLSLGLVRAAREPISGEVDPLVLRHPGVRRGEASKGERPKASADHP